MGKTNFQIREAHAEDLNLIRTLYFDVWGYNRPIEYDKWRFFGSNLGLCPIAVAQDGNRLAGAYSLWPINLKIMGKTVFGAQSMDTMSHPNYRGQGIFTFLAKECYSIAKERGIRVLYGFPNQNSYHGFVRKLGWTHTGDVTHWVRPICLSEHQKIPKIFGPVLNAVVKILPKGRETGFEVTSEAPTGKNFQKLLLLSKRSYKNCHIDRTLEWINWRYSISAHNSYRWVYVYRDRKLIAAGAWGIKDSFWDSEVDKRAHLVELLGEEVEPMVAAVSAIIKQTINKKALVLETLCNHELISKVLMRVGFFKYRKAPFIVRELEECNFSGELLKHENWCIMGGDIDTF